ncbi:hypothetical protein L9F63_002564, partial [Diploptera punctata]
SSQLIFSHLTKYESLLKLLPITGELTHLEFFGRLYQIPLLRQQVTSSGTQVSRVDRPPGDSPSNDGGATGGSGTRVDRSPEDLPSNDEIEPRAFICEPTPLGTR